MSDPPATIGLCMIVRDEAATIERCLASTREIGIDSWTICDTGSVDDTPRRIAAALSGIPGVLHRMPWQDFGHNRSELLALARGTADWLLLLDADMTLERRAPLPPLGDADAYLLRAAGELDYAVPRLVRGARAWRYEGATHEHLAADGPYTRSELPALAVVHHADGGSRADKLARDAALLERQLATSPDDPRTLFYLAQTRRDLGEDEQAVALYRRRAALGGWAEEAFYAAYQAGVLLARRDPLAGERQLLAAHALRPERAEPLCDLARLCRAAGRHADAYTFAERGLALPYPAGDVLFVHRDVYEWRLRFELSIAAHWVGRGAQALSLTDELLTEGRMPPAFERAALDNRAFSPSAPRSALPRLECLAPSLALGEIALDVEPDWPCCNPSVAADPAGDGFHMIVRTVNYELDAGGRYRMLDPGDETVRTLNYRVRLDGGLAVTDVVALGDATDASRVASSPVLGYEDCRLFSLNGTWYALATVADRAPSPRRQVALLTLDDAGIAGVRVLRGAAGRHEKNWLPLEPAVGDASIRLLYSAAPTVVLACDVQTGRLGERVQRAAPQWTHRLRGGSQGVAVDGGWLFVVHEVLPGGPLSRTYAHRFARLDGDGRLAAISRRFCFADEPIEYCAGLAREGNRLVISLGIMDRVAAIGVLTLDEALALLEPIELQLSIG